jgi:hypothetical protein
MHPLRSHGIIYRALPLAVAVCYYTIFVGSSWEHAFASTPFAGPVVVAVDSVESSFWSVVFASQGNRRGSCASTVGIGNRH